MSKTADWVTARIDWEAGMPVSKIASKQGVSRSRVYQVKSRDAWVPRLRSAVRDVIKTIRTGRPEATKIEATSSPNVDAAEGSGIKAIGKGRSIGQPMGEKGMDRDLLSKFGALSGLSTPEVKAVLAQASTEIELMKVHRTVIARASVVAENILTRLHALVVEGVAADVITFKTKTGQAYHRVAFLGDRESVSDALLKCANALSKLVPLERQAHGLMDKEAGTALPHITLSMPNVRVVSVDGRGKVIGKQDVPALIEGEAAAVEQ